jgi:hypothetical protein
MKFQVSISRACVWGWMVVVGFCSPALVAQQTDTTPPQLVSLTLSPATVDVTASDAVVTATWHVTDDLPGIFEILVAVSSPWGKQSVTNGNGFPNGVVEVTMPITLSIPRFSEPRTWTITKVFLNDRVLKQNQSRQRYLSGRRLLYLWDPEKQIGYPGFELTSKRKSCFVPGVST